MAKIVKLCSSCDEGFAEKFVFCPNCGSTLQAFEMNPVKTAAEPEQAALPVSAAPAFVEPQATPAAETERLTETASPAVEEPILEIEEAPSVAGPVEVPEAVVARETPVEPAYVAVPATEPVYVQAAAVDVDRKPSSPSAEQYHYEDDGVFRVTVIEEKNVKTRNGLLAGAALFMIAVLFGALVVNIFSKDLEVGSINDDIFTAVLMDDVPTVTEEKVEKKNDDKGGGGGGGGREEKEEVTQGDLADQTKTPIRPPDAKVPRLDNPELTLPPPSTQGNQTFEKKFDRWGDPNGRFASFSNGTGSGGGQGSGVGTGQGSGRGTGAGSGIGSGYGGGIGNGNGNGLGDGDGSGGSAPPPRSVGVTQGIKILSKPRPGYTDTARQKNIQGTVILRVTFLGSGAIGSISAVKGLSDGLTEQAIAAARRISFEPAKVNGVPQSVTKQIEYTFSIY